jgi:hypothetical protein
MHLVDLGAFPDEKDSQHCYSLRLNPGYPNNSYPVTVTLTLKQHINYIKKCSKFPFSQLFQTLNEVTKIA